jgi:hypothetical protein
MSTQHHEPAPTVAEALELLRLHGIRDAYEEFGPGTPTVPTPLGTAFLSNQYGDLPTTEAEGFRVGYTYDDDDDGERETIVWTSGPDDTLATAVEKLSYVAYAARSGEPWLRERLTISAREASTVEDIKQHIQQEIIEGSVPVTVRRWGELNSYVDMSGGWAVHNAQRLSVDLDINGVVLSRVDAWLAAGRPTTTQLRVEGTEVDVITRHTEQGYEVSLQALNGVLEGQQPGLYIIRPDAIRNQNGE